MVKLALTFYSLLDIPVKDVVESASREALAALLTVSRKIANQFTGPTQLSGPQLIGTMWGTMGCVARTIVRQRVVPGGKGRRVSPPTHE